MAVREGVAVLEDLLERWEYEGLTVNVFGSTVPAYRVEVVRVLANRHFDGDYRYRRGITGPRLSLAIWTLGEGHWQIIAGQHRTDAGELRPVNTGFMFDVVGT